MYEIFELLLKVRGISAAEFSRETGIDQSTLSNWKARGNYLKPELAFIVADYFGVSLDYLMRGKLKDGSAPVIKSKATYALIEAANKCPDSEIRQATNILENYAAYIERLRKTEKRLHAYMEKMDVLTKDKEG